MLGRLEAGAVLKFTSRLAVIGRQLDAKKPFLKARRKQFVGQRYELGLKCDQFTQARLK